MLRSTARRIEGVHRRRKDFSRKGQEKDERAKSIEARKSGSWRKNLSDEIRISLTSASSVWKNILGGKEVQADLHDEAHQTSAC